MDAEKIARELQLWATDDIVPSDLAHLCEIAATALRAAAAVREKTHVVVPREATDEMCAAGRQALRKGGLMPAYTDTGSAGQMPVLQFLLRDAWAAMIAAAGDHDGR